MAYNALLTILKKGVKVWNEWREKNPEIVLNIEGADLSHADLRQANLNRASLRHANLSHADLRRTDLSRADLSFAKLYDADLSDADLSDADLKEASLFSANLSQSDLSCTHLSHVDLRDADLNNGNLNGASLEYAILCDANLSNASLSGTNLRGTNLSYADLSGAHLDKAILGKTVFGNTNLRNSKELKSCIHVGPSIIDHQTLEISGDLPLVFLRGCGLPDNLIEYLPSLLNQPIQYYSCFISYSHADKPFARRLYDALQGQGIRCWVDEHQMLPGDDIYEQVDRGIRLWDKVLLCCSKASLTSWWIDNEIDSAFEKERRLMKERGQKVLALIPLNLDGYILSDDYQSGKKQQIKSRLAADFRNWKTNHGKFEQQLDKIIQALRSDDGSREVPPVQKL